MTAQHDESAESEKRLRYESSAFWDEARSPSSSGRWALGRVAKGVTNSLGSPGHSGRAK
jgi:hypothetical protein